jgi:hypothetical protein
VAGGGVMYCAEEFTPRGDGPTQNSRMHPDVWDYGGVISKVAILMKKLLR